MTMHPSITESRIVKAVKRDDNTGFCIACGKKAKSFVEPDAEGYPCEYKRCPSHTFTVGLEEKLDRTDGLGGTVYGAEQLLLMTVA